MVFSHKMLCGPRKRVYVNPIVPIDQQEQELYLGQLLKIALESNNQI